MLCQKQNIFFLVQSGARKILFFIVWILIECKIFYISHTVWLDYFFFKLKLNYCVISNAQNQPSMAAMDSVLNSTNQVALKVGKSKSQSNYFCSYIFYITSKFPWFLFIYLFYLIQVREENISPGQAQTVNKNNNKNEGKLTSLIRKNLVFEKNKGGWKYAILLLGIITYTFPLFPFLFSLW